jgi:cell division protein FtsB
MTAVQGTTAIRARPPARRPSLRLRPRRKTLIALMVAGVVAIVAFNVGRQACVGWSIEQQATDLQAQVEAAEAENAALQRQLEYLRSDAYVTAEARRLRTVGYPGEQVLVIPPGAAVQAPLSTTPAPVDDTPMLERWLTLFFGERP